MDAHLEILSVTAALSVFMLAIFRWPLDSTAPDLLGQKTITFCQSIQQLILASILLSGASVVASRPPALAADNVIGPVTFLCDDSSQILATFDNAPDPATVQLMRRDQTFTLPQAMSGSGARYVGDGIEFWNKGDNAMVEWQGQKLECSTAQ